MLANAGVPFEVAPHIVRGLDYYTDTVFELQVTNIGAQSAIGGGGRYDNLIKEIGGGNVPSVGFGIGIERALLALEAEGIEIAEPKPDAFIVSAGEHHVAVDALARKLRNEGFTAIVDLDRRSLKGQLKMADRSNCRFSIIIGDDEANGGYFTVRDMSISNQVSMSEGELIEALKQK
jgi:histidyl-tRNA synthetase